MVRQFTLLLIAKKCNRNALFNVNCHKRSCSVSWNTSLLSNLQRSDKGEEIKNYYFHLAWNWARNARWTRMYLDAHALNFALEAPYKACTQFRPKFKRYVPFNPDGFLTKVNKVGYSCNRTLHKQGMYGGQASIRRTLIITPGSLVKVFWYHFCCVI